MKYRSSSSWLKEKQLQLNLAQLLSSRSSQLKLAQSLSWVEPAQAGSIWLNTPWAGSAQLSSKKPDRVSAQLNGWARCKMPAQRTLHESWQSLWTSTHWYCVYSIFAKFLGPQNPTKVVAAIKTTLSAKQRQILLSAVCIVCLKILEICVIFSKLLTFWRHG